MTDKLFSFVGFGSLASVLGTFFTNAVRMLIEMNLVVHILADQIHGLRFRVPLKQERTLATFAGEPSQNVGKSFIKSYCAVCLEGAVIVLACIIFSLFASSPPVVDPNAAAVTQVWSYVGELLFNMLVLVGAVRMSDRIIREMMGL